MAGIDISLSYYTEFYAFQDIHFYIESTKMKKIKGLHRTHHDTTTASRQRALPAPILLELNKFAGF